METVSPTPGEGARRRAVILETTGSPFARLRPLGLTEVQLEDSFWEPRRALNWTVALQAQYEQLEATGRLDNFRRAARSQPSGEFKGLFFNDSDIYKWLEAVAWSLATEDNPALAARKAEVVALVGAAQGDDGYLDTYFMFERESQRWTDLRTLHELYCAGHLMQAAVADHRATGSTELLAIARRLADHIVATFGPAARRGACGHPEVEMALVELARETGDQRYLRQAQFFVDERGQRPPTISGEMYHQDHAPFREQHTVVGHAVRALYLYAGVTDIYTETGEQLLWDALEDLWTDLQAHKVYITGGVGARHEGESVGAAYELPNERAYAETCAAIAHVMWAWRMLLVTGEARFTDALEMALYNGVLPGVGLGGDTYYYENPLANRGDYHREPWFRCACCPPNVARLLASLPGYLYTTSDEGVWVHLFASSTATTALPGGGQVTLTQRTTYPWDGEIELAVTSQESGPFTLFVRIPGWVEGAKLRINDEGQDIPLEAGTYAAIRRSWQAGDVVRLDLPMPLRQIASHPHVTNNLGRVALMRGPLVYCVESADHPDEDVWDLQLPHDAVWTAQSQPDLLGGVVVARTQGYVAAPPAAMPLYRPAGQTVPVSGPLQVTAIPYYAWANRDPGPMQVWLPVAAPMD